MAPDEDIDEIIGQPAASYRIVKKLDQGAMGIVYLAEHPTLKRKAAVKVLKPELSLREELVQRFMLEALAASKLRHPGVVDVFDCGRFEKTGAAFIIMEFLEGESLASRLEHDARMPVPLALDLGMQIAAALSVAHDKGIVHRDLKPANVYLVEAPELPHRLRTKVLDFGIAKLTADAADGGNVQTQSGQMIGTPLYMSPEQFRGERTLDRRTDIYALGCMLYEMVAGEPPFSGEGWGDLVLAHMSMDAPSLEGIAGAPLAKIVRRALAKKAADRQQSMQELAGELESVATLWRKPERKSIETPSFAMESTFSSVASQSVAPPPPPRSSRRWLGGIAGGVLLVAVGVGLYARTTYSGRTTTASPPSIAPVQAAAAPPIAVAPPGTPAKTAAPAPAPPSSPSAVPAAAPPIEVELVIESKPPGADVFHTADGVRVGKTPFHTKVPRSPGEALYLLKRSGYKDSPVRLDAEHGGTVQVTLKKKGGGTDEPYLPEM